MLKKRNFFYVLLIFYNHINVIFSNDVMLPFYNSGGTSYSKNSSAPNVISFDEDIKTYDVTTYYIEGLDSFIALEKSNLNIPEIQSTEMEKSCCNGREIIYCLSNIQSTELEKSNLNIPEIQSTELEKSNLNIPEIQSTEPEKSNLNIPEIQSTEMKESSCNGREIIYCPSNIQSKQSQKILAYVARQSSEQDINDISNILKFINLKKLQTGRLPPPILVLPECFFNLNTSWYILYHAARGVSLNDILLKFTHNSQQKKLCIIMKNIGKSLYKFHDYFRPNENTVSNLINNKVELGYYSDSQTRSFEAHSTIPEDPSLARLLLSISHGDLNTGNIFVDKYGKISFIDYASMARDISSKTHNFSSVTNDIAYFISFIFCHVHDRYKDILGRELLENCMAYFLAGYLANNIPKTYHYKILKYVLMNYEFLLRILMVPDNIDEDKKERRNYFIYLFTEKIYPQTVMIIDEEIENIAQQKIAQASKNYKKWKR